MWTGCMIFVQKYSLERQWHLELIHTLRIELIHTLLLSRSIPFYIRDGSTQEVIDGPYCIIWNQTFLNFTRNYLLLQLKFTVLKYGKGRMMWFKLIIRNKKTDLKFLLFGPLASLTFLSFWWLNFLQNHWDLLFYCWFIISAKVFNFLLSYFNTVIWKCC